MRRALFWMGGAAAVTVALAQDRRPAPEQGLYFFFSQDTPRLAETAAALRALDARVRPVFLPTGLRDWPEDLGRAARALGGFAVVDEEGLALARRFGVRHTPTFVSVDARGTHVAAGSRTNLKEVLSCGRRR